MADETFTEYEIGGISCFIDPDSVSISCQPHAEVVPSLDGTNYVVYVKTNEDCIGYLSEIQVSGIYLPEASASSLLAKAQAKTIVSVKLPGISANAKYLIRSVTINPMKPGVKIGGDTLIKIRFAYNISLMLVNPEQV